MKNINAKFRMHDLAPCVTTTFPFLSPCDTWCRPIGYNICVVLLDTTYAYKTKQLQDKIGESCAAHVSCMHVSQPCDLTEDHQTVQIASCVDSPLFLLATEFFILP